jgi:hypothetical protein
MKTLRFATFIVSLTLAVSAIANAQMMGHKPPVPMTPAQFSQAVPGQNVQIAVRVTTIKRTTATAQLLEHQSDTVSKATGKHVTLYMPDGTPIVMGTARDIVPGAILFVSGILTKPGHVDVKQAVVDTRFVKVQ